MEKSGEVLARATQEDRSKSGRTSLLRRWGMFALRWGVAVGGIWWVIANMSLRDHVTMLDEHGRPVQAMLAKTATDKSSDFEIYDPQTGQRRTIGRDQTINEPDRKQVVLSSGQKVNLLGLDLSGDLKTVGRLLIADPANGGEGRWIGPADVQGGFQIHVPHPRVEAGIINMLASARTGYVWGAVFVFFPVLFITSVRWNALLRVMGIRLTQSRTFVLNIVGCFYNNVLMLGSMGGDVFKAYYAAKQTEHKTYAVLSVIIDRAIGLLALIILGGTMAAAQYLLSGNRLDPASVACKRIALGSAAILVMVLLGLGVLATTKVRRMLGVDWALSKLPMQKAILHATQAMRAYRRRPLVAVVALVMTFPVHILVVTSALLAGKALGLPLPSAYYFVAVPVIVLAGSLPISPQGAGVMEFMAIQLTKQYGTTVSQAFALTMSIRLVQMMWNLTGGVFVLRGGYHAPTQAEQEELEAEEAVEATV